MRMDLIIAGRPHAGTKLTKTNLKGSRIAVDLSGKCNSCKSADLMIIDEVQFSSLSRGLDYFASGAYETNVSAKNKFLTESQSNTLLRNIGLNKLSFNGKSLLEEFFLPADLKNYFVAKNKNKAKAAVSLGKKLFTSPLLSVDKNLVPQKDVVKRKPISCASCHVPSKAFTDGERIASGIKMAKFNTPTILNRALGRKHFFDRRSDSLFEQVLRPISNPDEMNSDLKNVVKALAKNKNISKQFKKAGLKIDARGIATALTMFTIQQTKILDSLAVLRSNAAEIGQKLFFGKARCASCHNGGFLNK